MKIFAAGDLHGDTRLADKLAEEASKAKVDLVILCGDIAHDELNTSNLIGPFKKRNLEVALVPGNHETLATANFLSELYGASNLHGYSMILGDIGIFGCGGGNLIGPNLTVTEEEAYNLLKKGHEAVKDVKKKIMVTHVPPSDSLIERLSFQCSSGVRKALDKFKPDLHLCGHMHEAEGIEEAIGKTKVINVGIKGKIIEF